MPIVTGVEKKKGNKITSQRKTHTPRRFLYLRETKSWWCEEGEGGGEEEKVSMLTHTTARGVGKNVHLLTHSPQGAWVKITF